MCLENAKQITLTQDLTVYKVLQAKIDEMGVVTYVAPYRQTEYSVPSSNRSNISISSYESHFFLYDVIREGLHSFETYEDAEREAIYFSRINGSWNNNYEVYTAWCVVECVIPKHAKTYIGDFMKFISYASNELHVQKVVSKYYWRTPILGLYSTFGSKDMQSIPDDIIRIKKEQAEN